MRGRETSERRWRSSVPRPFRSFLIALQFLTRLPSPFEFDASARDVARSVAWFPVVGLLIGLLLLGLDRVASEVVARPVVNALIVWALVAVTGALHVDGLIDTADGLSSGPGADDRLQAMRQSTVGVPGAVAGCAIVFAGYAALSGLSNGARPLALLMAPLCGRGTILLGYGVFAYPRPGLGMSQSLKEGATRGRVAGGLLIAAGVSMVLVGAPGLLLLALSLILGLAVGRLMGACVPGLTGDNHGAICELTQLVVLVAAPTVLAP
jgi:adenosylcobinamide-GDP ribazoletransferase